MKIDEALHILNQNGYLTERTIQLSDGQIEDLFRSFVYDYGIKPKYIEAFEKSGEDYDVYVNHSIPSKSNLEFMITPEDLMNVDCPVIDISDEELEKLLLPQGLHLRVSGYPDSKNGRCKYYIESINTKIIYPKPGDVFCHFSEAEPEKILKTGLRCRGDNTKGREIEKSENWYGKRIYLTKLSKSFLNYVYTYLVPSESDEDNNVDCARMFRYTIKLPTTFPLHKDPEYGKDRYYTYQNIPAKFIKFEEAMPIKK